MSKLRDAVAEATVANVQQRIVREVLNGANVEDIDIGAMIGEEAERICARVRSWADEYIKREATK